MTAPLRICIGWIDECDWLWNYSDPQPMPQGSLADAMGRIAALVEARDRLDADSVFHYKIEDGLLLEGTVWYGEECD